MNPADKWNKDPWPAPGFELDSVKGFTRPDP